MGKWTKISLSYSGGLSKSLAGSGKICHCLSEAIVVGVLQLGSGRVGV